MLLDLNFLSSLYCPKKTKIYNLHRRNQIKVTESWFSLLRPSCLLQYRLQKPAISERKPAMSEWADTIPPYTRWQLKHQLAMWKYKVLALEFENQVLRETIRDLYLYDPTNGNSSDEPDSSGYVGDTSEESMDNESDSDSESEAVAARDSEDELKQELAEAEIEREGEAIMEQASMNPHPNEDRTDEYKMLYGDDWQRIVASENLIDS